MDEALADIDTGTNQIMVDKIMTVKRDKLGPSFGRLDQDLLIEVERSMAVFLGIAK
jgi:mRNA interferase MazF